MPHAPQSGSMFMTLFLQRHSSKKIALMAECSVQSSVCDFKFQAQLGYTTRQLVPRCIWVFIAPCGWNGDHLEK